MQSFDNYTIVPISETLRHQVQPLVNDAWDAPLIVVNGELCDTRKLPGIAALSDRAEVIGYLLYTFHDGVCEIMALQSLHEGMGVGTRLIERLQGIAREQGAKKVVVTTTNDNLKAFRFYQRRGFTLRALRPNALALSRRLKPVIPLMSPDGIPLRDEIEFEMGIE